LRQLEHESRGLTITGLRLGATRKRPRVCGSARKQPHNQETRPGATVEERPL